MRSVFVLATAFAISVVTGCSSQAPGLPTPVACKGTATLPNGEPLRSVRLTFHPDQPTGIPVDGLADTDSKGKFEVFSYKKGDGIVPGKYIVSVEPFDYNNPSPTKNKTMAALIPKKYDEGSTSDIKIEITSEKNDLQIRLTP